MEEDTEVLDWGHEDDEQQYEQRLSQQMVPMDGVDDPEEDAVSLGGDEDDVEHYYAYQSAPNHEVTQVSLPVSKGPSVAVSQQQQQQQHQQQVSLGNREHQRDNSGNSHKTHSQSQPSPQQSSPIRSQSFGKMMHSLPPKPVLSSIPFLQPTHPSSIIEATAMSSSIPREKKLNGSAVKPLSPGGAGDSLPPDWEVKHARSGGGVYFYNVRTRQSTWSRPVSGAKSPAKDKERGRTQTLESRPSIRSGNSSPNQLRSSRTGRSEEPQAVLPPALSYDDRHYRPGDSAQISNAAEKRREERFDSNNHKRSLTPPRSPRMLSPGLPIRPPSSTGRGRDDKRASRSRRKSSPPTTAAGDLATLRDSQREKIRSNVPRVSPPDRHWAAPQDPPLRKTSGRRPPSDHRQREGAAIASSPPATPTNNEDRDSSFRNDADWSSTPRHRSPPPHMREPNSMLPAQAGHTEDLSPPLQRAPRARSRFDQPASTSPKTSRAQPAKLRDYIPDNRLVGKDQEPELTSAQVGGSENDPKRRCANDSAAGTSSSSHRAAEPAPVLAPPLNERSKSNLSLSPIMGEQSRLKRVPLPSQSIRFREMSTRRPTAKPDPPPSAPQAALPTFNDGGMMQNSTNAENSLPSGPRHQPQQNMTSQNTNQVELRNSSRLPPSGPSAGGAIIRPRRSEPNFTSNQLSAARDRNAMDVDPATLAKPPPLRVNDIPIRLNSGMYADREQQRIEMSAGTDAAPRGPRAMTSRMPSSSSHFSLVSSSSTSPTTPLYTQRPTAPQEFAGSKLRERSPPPHLVGSNGFQTRDAPARFSQADGGAFRSGIPARRVSNASDRGPSAQGHYQPGDSQQLPRRDPLSSHVRQDQFLQAPPPAPRGFSGSNSIPIGNRKVQNTGPPQANSSQPVSMSRYSMPSGVNVESARSRPTRGELQDHNSFEASASSPVDRYDLPERNDHSRQRSFGGHISPPHQHSPHSPMDSFQMSAAPGRSRSHNWYSVANIPDPVVRASQEASEPRTWTQRQVVQQPPSYDHIENDFRAASSPPLSREPSWDAVERRRSTTQYQAERPQSNSQYDIVVRHDGVEMEPRHRRQPEVEVDRKRDRVSHPASTRRSSVSHDSRIVQQSNDRYQEDLYRLRDAPSPSVHRHSDSFSGHVPYTNDARRPAFSDDRRAPPVTERRTQSWDRDPAPHRERPSTGPDRNIHPDRARVFEVENHQPSGAKHDSSATQLSKPVRIRRPESQIAQNHLDDYPMRSEVATEHWQSSRSRDEQRNRDIEEPSSSTPTAHRRPTSSRRGGSLLDRLSLDNGVTSPMSPQSLRDRVQVPSKRDREETGNDSTGDIDMDDSGGPGDPGSKRPRRRLKPKRGRRNGTS